MSPADTEASHEPTRHQDREDHAGRGSHADGLPLEPGPLPGGVSASQDHRQRGHQEEQEVAGWRLREVGPDDRRAGGQSLGAHRYRRRDLRVAEEGRGDAPSGETVAATHRRDQHPHRLVRQQQHVVRDVHGRLVGGWPGDRLEVGPGRAGADRRQHQEPDERQHQAEDEHPQPPGDDPGRPAPPRIVRDQLVAARSQAAGGPRRGREQQGEHEPREARRWHLEAPLHQPVPRDRDVDAHEPGHHEWGDRVRGRHLHPVEDSGHCTAACPVRHGAAPLVQDRDREERAQHHREPHVRREAGFAAFDRGQASRDGRVVEPPEIEPAQLGGRPGRLAGCPGEVHAERHRLPEGGHHHEGQPTPGQPGAPPPGEDGDLGRPPPLPGRGLGSDRHPRRGLVHDGALPAISTISVGVRPTFELALFVTRPRLGRFGWTR